MIRLENPHKWVKGADGHRYHPAQIIKFDSTEDYQAWSFEQDKKGKSRKIDIIPCGKCIGCRLEYSRQWATRGYLESLDYEQNWFCTITYDEDHITTLEEVETKNGLTYWNDGTWNGTLVPKELTQFIKNVRQIMQRKYKKELKTWQEKAHKKDPKTPKKPKKPRIRYMACGEYGTAGERPHYHIIFFNLNLPVEDLYSPRIINHEVYYQSHIIENAWGKGICNISEATWNSIAYTARYITKKINGAESEDYYAEKGQEKEFFRVSRMPGIGENYFKKHWKEIYENDEIIIKNKAGAIATQPPKYFDRLLEKKSPETLERVKIKRKRRAKQNNQVNALETSLFEIQQLEIAERLQDEKTLRLVREFEKGFQ